MADKAPAEEVFTTFSTDGWLTAGVACFVGLNGPVPYLCTADSCVHLAEELQNASYTLPRAMIATAVFNDVFAFLVVGTSADTVIAVGKYLQLCSHPHVHHWRH